MIPVGYMYKVVEKKPDWLKSKHVVDIYSVSRCMSEDFGDWVSFWKHNGYWFFDSPKIIQDLAKKNHISLKEMTLFYYLAYEKQWDDDDRQWLPYEPEKTFLTKIVEWKEAKLQGYDIVSSSGQSRSECSPLSCNNMAKEIRVNKHCLIDSFKEAKKYLEEGKFQKCEPGLYRIFEVYTVKDA